MKQTPCLDCPFLGLQEGQEYFADRYLESFDMKISMKANGLIWEDGTNVAFGFAYMIWKSSFENTNIACSDKSRIR